MRVPKALIKLTGDLFLAKKPMFIQYKPSHHKVKGSEVRQVLDCVKEGDILLRRFDGYLNTMLTPGFWGHAALYVGKNTIIHSVGQGVVNEDLLDFCRCDSVCILGIKSATAGDITTAIVTAINKAKGYVGRVGYDYYFEPGIKALYCTEMVDACYDGIFRDDYETIAGNKVLTPDGIRKSKQVYKILEIKH